jgi:hypothetical protein
MIAYKYAGGGTLAAPGFVQASTIPACSAAHSRHPPALLHRLFLSCLRGGELLLPPIVLRARLLNHLRGGKLA